MKNPFYFFGTRKPDFRNIYRINYDEYWGKRGLHLNGKLKEREVIMLDRIAPGSRVLDIGCGNSLLPVMLDKKGVKISVADISTVILNLFKEHKISTQYLNLEDFSSLHFDKRFDYIIMSEVLEHTYNPEDIVRSLAKYTDRFIITIPNSGFYRYRLHLLFSGRFFVQWAHHPSEHIRFWTHSDLMDWFSALDLVVEEAVASNGFSFFGLAPWLKNVWKNLFAYQIVYICHTKK